MMEYFVIWLLGSIIVMVRPLSINKQMYRSMIIVGSVFVALVSMKLLYAWIISLFTEFRTTQIREFFLRRISSPKNLSMRKSRNEVLLGIEKFHN